MKHLYRSKAINHPMFSVYLNDNQFESWKDNIIAPSELIIGAYDASKFPETAEWKTLQVISEEFWATKLMKVSLGEDEIQTKARRAIFDTGTSYLAVPTQDLYSIHSLLMQYGMCKRSNRVFTCDCGYNSVITNYPLLTFQLSDKTVSLEPDQYML